MTSAAGSWVVVERASPGSHELRIRPPSQYGDGMEEGGQIPAASALAMQERAARYANSLTGPSPRPRSRAGRAAEARRRRAPRLLLAFDPLDADEVYFALDVGSASALRSALRMLRRKPRLTAGDPTVEVLIERRLALSAAALVGLVLRPWLVLLLERRQAADVALRWSEPPPADVGGRPPPKQTTRPPRGPNPVHVGQLALAGATGVTAA